MVHLAWAAPSNDGAAYLYVEAAGVWPSTPTATFAGAPGTSGKLGSAVALSADGTVALVTWSPDCELRTSTQGLGNLVTPAATFTGPPSTDGGGEFGSAVALSADGQVALVGAPGAGTSYDGAGYLYSELGATWPSSPTAFFPGPPAPVQRTATRSPCHHRTGESPLLGAPEGGPFQDGVAFIYAESGGTWPLAPAASFLGPTASGAWLGQSVALSANGQVALLGAPIGGDAATLPLHRSGHHWSTVAASTFTGPADIAGRSRRAGSPVRQRPNSVLGDAPFTGAGAIDGAAYAGAPAGSASSPDDRVHFRRPEPGPFRGHLQPRCDVHFRSRHRVLGRCRLHAGGLLIEGDVSPVHRRGHLPG